MSEKEDSDAEMDEQVEETQLKVPQSSSDDDEDDDSSNEDDMDEAESMRICNYIETLKRIDKNKYSYEDYVALVTIAQ